MHAGSMCTGIQPGLWVTHKRQASQPSPICTLHKLHFLDSLLAACQPPELRFHANSSPASLSELTLWTLQVTVKNYVEDTFGFAYNMRGWTVLILIAFVAVFRIGSMAALRVLVFQKR